MSLRKSGNPYGDHEITEPGAMRALAHPVRLAILSRLQGHGPATATELSEHVDVGLHAHRLAVTVLVALPGRIRRGLVIVPGLDQQMIIRAALLSFSLVILYLPNSSTHI